MLKFIQEWLPSLAVIIGGLWILFQWLFGEWQREKKEIPALDGKLSATIIPCEQDRLLVTVEGLWTNHSPFPIYLDIQQCRIDVFRFDPQFKNANRAVVLKRDLGEPIIRHHFLVGMCEKDYFLEPDTASRIINHFVLEPGVYGVRMELYTAVANINWWKELIVDARKTKH